MQKQKSSIKLPVSKNYLARTSHRKNLIDIVLSTISLRHHVMTSYRHNDFLHVIRKAMFSFSERK